jgi:hypothetical protein
MWNELIPLNRRNMHVSLAICHRKSLSLHVNSSPRPGVLQEPAVGKHQRPHEGSTRGGSQEPPHAARGAAAGAGTPTEGSMTGGGRESACGGFEHARWQRGARTAVGISTYVALIWRYGYRYGYEYRDMSIRWFSKNKDTGIRLYIYK